MKLIEFSVGENESVWVEVSDQTALSTAGTVVKTGTGVQTVVDGLQRSLDSSLDQLTALCKTVLEKVREAGPSEFEVEMGLKLDAKAGVVLTSVSSGVHFTVTMKWSKDAS